MALELPERQVDRRLDEGGDGLSVQDRGPLSVGCDDHLHGVVPGQRERDEGRMSPPAADHPLTRSAADGMGRIGALELPVEHRGEALDDLLRSPGDGDDRLLERMELKLRERIPRQLRQLGRRGRIPVARAGEARDAALDPAKRPRIVKIAQPSCGSMRP
jgi:hypothetical protein